MELNSECPICKDPIVDAASTSCSHTFCRVCLKHWLLHHPSCPYCRKYITTCSDGPVTDEYRYVLESPEIIEVPKKRGVAVWTRIRHEDTGDVHFAAKVENILQCYFIAKSDNELSSTISTMDDSSFIFKLNRVRQDKQYYREYEECLTNLEEYEVEELQYLEQLDFRVVNHLPTFYYDSDGEPIDSDGEEHY